MKKPKWFVKVWNWDENLEEYVPDIKGFYTEAEARAAYESVEITADTNGASLIDSTSGRFVTIDWKPI